MSNLTTKEPVKKLILSQSNGNSIVSLDFTWAVIDIDGGEIKVSLNGTEISLKYNQSNNAIYYQGSDYDIINLHDNDAFSLTFTYGEADLAGNINWAESSLLNVTRVKWVIKDHIHYHGKETYSFVNHLEGSAFLIEEGA